MRNRHRMASLYDDVSSPAGDLKSRLSVQPVEDESSSLFTSQSRRLDDANWLQLALLPWIIAAETTAITSSANLFTNRPTPLNFTQ